jgi:hypothetical protein
MGLPGWPPGLVPGMELCKYRPWPFDRQLPDGAICAAVDLLDHERAHCNVSEIGIELDCVFHFEFSFFCYNLDIISFD